MNLKQLEIITSHTDYPAPYSHRVLMVCHEKEIAYHLTKINTEEKPSWFLQLNPLGQVPVLRVNEATIVDSHAICEYLEEAYKPKLLPENIIERAQYRSWMAFADELAQEISCFVKSGKLLSYDLSRLNFLLNIANQKITLPYFCGENFSLVDIYLVSHILWLDALAQFNLLPTALTQYEKIHAWLVQLKKRPALAETIKNDYAEQFIALLKQYKLIA